MGTPGQTSTERLQQPYHVLLVQNAQLAMMLESTRAPWCSLGLLSGIDVLQANQRPLLNVAMPTMQPAETTEINM